MAKEKGYTIKYIRPDPETADRAMRAIVKREIEKVLAKHRFVSYNLDEVLSKYISEEMRNGYKERQGLCEGIDTERLAEG